MKEVYTLTDLDNPAVVNPPDAKPAKLAVIGNPVAHSRSPQLHQPALDALGIEARYIRLQLEPGELATACAKMKDLGFVGTNVTVPHKEIVMDIADLITDRATLIGAANTLIFRKDGKIHADNTDGFGFIQNLRSGAPDWNPKSGPALVLGAGGAARAVVASLSDAGVSEIYLSNRTRARAEKLKDDFGKRVRIVVLAGRTIGISTGNWANFVTFVLA